MVSVTLGGRYEWWRAYDGFNFSSATTPARTVNQPGLSAEKFSPKASVTFQPAEHWTLMASYGDAYRFPTVSELYQTVASGINIGIPNPNLRPEHARSLELAAERRDSGRFPPSSTSSCNPRLLANSEDPTEDEMNAKHLLGSVLSKWAVGMFAVSLGVTAHAHVTVSPKESTLGKQETYTFTIPTEGAVATIGVEIDVPPEVTIISIGGYPASYSVKKDGERIVTISRTVNIPPGGGQKVTLVAQNPTVPTRRLRWNAHQLFADGTRTSWSELPPAKPAPMVPLLAE